MEKKISDLHVSYFKGSDIIPFILHVNKIKNNMNLTQAIQILKLHNQWRRWPQIDLLSPKLIGEAIDKVIELEKARFCPYCGNEKINKISTDINSELVCKWSLCREFVF